MYLSMSMIQYNLYLSIHLPYLISCTLIGIILCFLHFFSSPHALIPLLRLGYFHYTTCYLFNRDTTYAFFPAWIYLGAAKLASIEQVALQYSYLYLNLSNYRILDFTLTYQKTFAHRDQRKKRREKRRYITSAIYTMNHFYICCTYSCGKWRRGL